MKKNLFISLLLLIFISSCEDTSDSPYIIKFYGDAYEDIGYSVTILSDGYVLAGQLTVIKRISKPDGTYIDATTVNQDMEIIKVGWEGNVIWKVNAGGKFNDRGYKILPLDDGSLVCTGIFTDTTTTTAVQTDVFIVKVSSTGEIIWQKKYGGPGNQSGKDIVKTSDGFIIAGNTDEGRPVSGDSIGNVKGKSDIYLLKINETGDSVVSYAHGYPGNEYANVIKQDISGGCIVLGTTDRSYPGQAKNNLFLVKINSLCLNIGSNIVGGTDDEYGADMEVLYDGYLLAGTIGKDGESQKVFVKKMKKDIYATPLFTNYFPAKDAASTEKPRAVNSICKYKTDSFLIAGNLGNGSSAKFLVFEIDAEGNAVNGHEMVMGNSGIQIAYDVSSGDDGFIIAVGKNSIDANSLISFLKFRF